MTVGNDYWASLWLKISKGDWVKTFHTLTSLIVNNIIL
jgi:hypothetical protein